MADPLLTLKMPPDKSLDEIEWRTYPHDPRYRVSEYGHVIGPKGHLLRPCIQRGYAKYTMFFKGKHVIRRVHLMVLQTFGGDRPYGASQIAHWVGDPLNNHYSNLRYATPLENVGDTMRHGRLRIGERAPGAKLTDDRVREIRRLRSEGRLVYRRYAAKLGIAWETVRGAAVGRTWKHIK